MNRPNTMLPLALAALALAGCPVTRAAERAPTMGWASWNAFFADVTEEIVLAQAEVMATNGLKAAGYRYINIDDGAFHGRDEKGFVRPNEKRFPNGFKGITKRIHELGLKAGTYSDAGSDTCSGIWSGDVWGFGTGLYGYDEQDCRQRFLDWGFDYFKVDFCGGDKLKLKLRDRYPLVRRAIDATGRKDVVLNICCWRYDGAWLREVGDSWRTTGDIRANWKSLRHIIGVNMYLSPYGGFGHYNDMDMMQVGRYVGKVKRGRFAEGKDDTGITEEEELTHFGLWCIFESPLQIGCDLRELPATTLKLITNPELIAMNQAEPHEQAYIARAYDDGTYAFVKDADCRFGTSRFVALYNPTDGEKAMKLDFGDVDLAGKVGMRDLARREDVGSREGTYEVAVPPHATRFYKLKAERRIDRRVYEAELAFLNEYRAWADPEKLEFAANAKWPKSSGGRVVRFLGKRASNYLEWRDVRVSETCDCRLEFRYFAPDSREFNVQVDGGAPVRLAAPAKYGTPETVSMPVRLSAGCHTVRLWRDGDWAPDFDFMRVVKVK